MNKTILLFCFTVLLSFAGLSQTVTLTFTGRDGGNKHVAFDYVKITNVTKDWREYLFWPDTVLTIQNGTGTQDTETDHTFSLQLSPNPFNGATEVALSVAEEGKVHLEIADVNGHLVRTNDYSRLEPGMHRFRMTLAHAGVYVLSAQQNGKMSAVKVLSYGGGKANSLDYLGIAETDGREVFQTKSHVRGLATRPFDVGDQMEYVGYAIINDEEVQSEPLELPLSDLQTYVLQFISTQIYLPTVITANLTEITNISAVCGGTVVDDGYDSVTARGVCLSTSPNPTLIDRHTVDGAGLGNFTSQLTGLSSNHAYYVRAYATNGAGTAYGEETRFLIPIDTSGDERSCLGTPYVTDVDSNRYNTLQIGNQCWLRENLRTTRYADGTAIPQGNTSSITTGYWYYPMNDPTLMFNYGLLYNWPAVMHGAASSNTNPSGVQGVCPDGWHVPSDAEWMQFFSYVTSQSQYMCGGYYIGKSLAATAGWQISTLENPCVVGNTNPSTNNATGFGALPAGFYNVNAAPTVGGEFGGLSYVTFFWSSTATPDSYGYNDIHYVGLHTNDASVIHNELTDTDGEAQSVRCVKN